MATANPQPTKTKPLIQRVEVRNFKCLRAVDVDLEPLTVLIGKNDTGKSSFLEAMTYLVSAFSGSTVSGSAYVTHHAKIEDLAVSLHIGNKEFTVQGWDQRAGKPKTNSRSSGKFPLPRVQPPYRLVPDLLRQPARVGELSGPLPPKGEHLAAALDRLPLSRMVQLQKELVARIDTVQELVLLPHQKGSKAIWRALSPVKKLWAVYKE